jgi:AbrB family looped-hinge helix DNA binding protein
MLLQEAAFAKVHPRIGRFRIGRRLRARGRNDSEMKTGDARADKGSVHRPPDAGPHDIGRTPREFTRAVDGPVVRRYLTSMKTTVSSKGQIVLPAELRQMDRIEPGQEFDVERLDRGDYRLVRRAARPNDGAIDWLLACPEKGFFVPVESESTDTL